MTISRRSLLLTVGAAGAAAGLSSPLWARTPSRRTSPAAATAPATCELALRNKSLPGTVNAYVTGHEQGTDRWLLLRADGSRYYPDSPARTVTPLAMDCAIPVGAAGSAPAVLTLPQMYGARIYVVHDNTLDFFLNPGPALVEPAAANPSDANFARNWTFCEFTFNPQELYANLTYVDFVTALPLGLTLEGDGTHTVAPAPSGSVQAIADGLVAQTAKDGRPWDKLVLRDPSGNVLRVTAPQLVIGPSLNNPDQMPFRDAFTGYIDQVWAKYRDADLHVDLQYGRGVLTGRVTGDTLTFNGGHAFAKPSSADVFTCNGGPFANNPADPDAKKALVARLAAGFNRGIMLTHPDQPNGVTAAEYYQGETTNHWARLVHANTPIGYAFPYDDVCPDGQPDVSGAVADGNPRRLTVTLG